MRLLPVNNIRYQNNPYFKGLWGETTGQNKATFHDAYFLVFKPQRQYYPFADEPMSNIKRVVKRNEKMQVHFENTPYRWKLEVVTLPKVNIMPALPFTRQEFVSYTKGMLDKHLSAEIRKIIREYKLWKK